MKLIKRNNSQSVISNSGREYELAELIGLDNGYYDIIVILDMGEDRNYENQAIVDFFYGAGDFKANPIHALDYIKNVIEKYEAKTYYEKDNNYEVIKEF